MQIRTADERFLLLTSAVESVTLRESLMGRISDSLRFPPKKALKSVKLLVIEVFQLQYLITAMFTGATQVTDCAISMLRFKWLTMRLGRDERH